MVEVAPNLIARNRVETRHDARARVGISAGIAWIDQVEIPGTRVTVDQHRLHGILRPDLSVVSEVVASGAILEILPRTCPHVVEVDAIDSVDRRHALRAKVAARTALVAEFAVFAREIIIELA